MIRITKQFTFHMAHAIEGYEGLCAHIHGHEYSLQVTVAGNHDNDGMVIDFKKLKELVQERVLDEYDHSLILKDTEKSRNVADSLKAGWGNVHIVPFQPSSENIVLDMVRRLDSAFPDGVSLFSLRLCETGSSWVEWFKNDD